MQKVIWNNDFYQYIEQNFTGSPWWNLLLVIPLSIIIWMIYSAIENKAYGVPNWLFHGGIIVVVILFTATMFPIYETVEYKFAAEIDFSNKSISIYENDQQIDSFDIREVRQLLYEIKETKNKETKIYRYTLYSQLENGLELYLGLLQEEDFNKIKNVFSDKYQIEAQSVVEDALKNTFNSKKISTPTPKTNFEKKEFTWTITIRKAMWLFVGMLICFWLFVAFHFYAKRFSIKILILLVCILSFMSFFIGRYILLNYRSNYSVVFEKDKLMLLHTPKLIDMPSSEMIDYKDIAEIQMNANPSNDMGIMIFKNKEKWLKTPDATIKVESISLKQRIEIFKALHDRLSF